MPSKILIEQAPVKEQTPKAPEKKQSSSNKKQRTIGSFFTKDKKSTPKPKKEIVFIDVSDEDEQVINISTVEKKEGINVIEDQSDGSVPKCRNLLLSMDAEVSNSSFSEKDDEKNKECRNLLLSMDAECSNMSLPQLKAKEQSQTAPIDIDKIDSNKAPQVDTMKAIDKEDSDDPAETTKEDNESSENKKSNETENSNDTEKSSNEIAEHKEYCKNLQLQCETKLMELVKLGKEEESDQDLENLEVLKEMPSFHNETSFPDALLPYLACIIQGR